MANFRESSRGPAHGPECAARNARCIPAGSGRKFPLRHAAQGPLWARLFLAGDGGLRHRNRIGGRKRVLERLLQRSFLFAFLGPIAWFVLAAAFGHRLFGWHVSPPRNDAPRPTVTRFGRGSAERSGRSVLVHGRLAQHVRKGRGFRRRSDAVFGGRRAFCRSFAAQHQWITSTTVLDRGSTMST